MMGAKMSLVIMAAGLGTRYGGLKQLEPVGPRGAIILDYSVYDALRAGFDKVVFIVKRELKDTFKGLIGDRISAFARVEYVCQGMDLPRGYAVPEGRTAPWGTGHAVLSCADAVKEPFAVINADDFYGRGTFSAVAGFLSDLSGSAASGAVSDEAERYCMAAFKLKNTLTEHGHVARGVCRLDGDSYLKGITERTRIEKRADNGAQYTDDGVNWVHIPGDTPVSMNMWGFTPGLFPELRRLFPLFLDENAGNLAKAEFFLPSAVGRLIDEGRASVKVLKTPEQWLGVTYRQDRDRVAGAIYALTERGEYPEDLWADGPGVRRAGRI